jgi:Uma2 family endonuclease
MPAVVPIASAGATSPPDNETLYEVINGQFVEPPPMGVYETTIASLLHGYMNPFARTHLLGRAVQEVLFVLDPVAILKRRPDVAFVSFQRWPKNRRVPRAEAWGVIPNLAAEVISSSNTTEQDIAKVKEYFRAGVELVWVILPVVEQIYVYESPTKIRVLSLGEELEGATVLPGFRLPLTDLFELETTSEDNGPTISSS